MISDFVPFFEQNPKAYHYDYLKIGIKNPKPNMIAIDFHEMSEMHRLLTT